MPYGIIKLTLDRKKHCYNPGIYIDQRKQDYIIKPTENENLCASCR